MNSKITYHQQISYCGKPRCRKCREGIGHGPYWYAYQTVNGRTTRTYVGKHLPPGVQTSLEDVPEIVMERPLATNLSTELDSVSIRISTLGQFRLERRGGRDAAAWQAVTDSAWQQPRVRMLLAYLICAPERKVNRDQALEDLWPDSAVSVATNNLHRAVHHLRQVLGHQRATSTQELLLRSEGDWLMLAGQAYIWIDADAFEALLAQVDALGIHIEAGTDAMQLAQRERMLKQAAALYSNDFLPEERYAEWVSARRLALRRNWVRLLLELADVYIAQGASASAIDVLDRVLSKDPANEAAVQRLIVVLARLKRRGEALRAYHRLADVLYREYQSVPSIETRALYETVRQGGTLTSEAITASPPQETLTPVQPATPPQQPTPAASATEPGGSAVAAPMQIGRSHQSQLVGREAELEVLHTLLFDTEQHARLQLVGQRRLSGIPLDTQRRPQCAMLMGEAGIGKTRLAEELSREAQRRGWTVAWGRIYSQEGGIPYRIWTDVLRKILDTGSGLAPALHLPALTSIAQETLQPLTALLPELATVTQPAVQQTARRQAMSVQVGEGERGQVRLWEAVQELLLAAGEGAPLLIVLDDIQWADVSSFELLGYLARHLYGYPVLLLGTCRETELPSYPPHPLRTLIAHMQREHSVMTLNIEPLTSEQIAQLVSHLPETMVQLIQEQAAGNPFFAEELARTSPPALPRTIADALDHRLSRLSAPCLQLLGTAAVLGGSFEFPIIYAMDAGGIAGDEDTVLDLLEEGLQAGVLTEEGVGTRITYRFWHPLLVSHLYERLSAARRLRLHQRAADALLSMHQKRPEEVAATITYHLIKGGAEPVRIARFAELAGDHAYALSAYAEAGRYYRLALENVGEQPAPASSEETPHLIFLLERLAECTVILGDFVEARNLYLRALELHRARNEAEPASSPTAVRYKAQIQALLWGEIGWTWRYTGDSERARECCRRGEQVLREAGVIAGPAWARLLHQEGSLYWQEGRYEEARRAAQEALALFEQQQKLPTGPLNAATDGAPRTTRIQRTLEGDPADLGLTHRLLGALANAEGRRTEALEHLTTALAIFEQYDHKRRIAHVSSDLGHVYLKKAKYELAQSSLRRALSLAERLGDTPLTALVFYNLAELAAAAGDLDESEGWYRRALALAERINDREYVSMWNVGLAGVLQEEEKLDEAATCIIRALALGRAMRNDPCIGAALVALGTMRITQARAVQNLTRARERLLKLARRDVERALSLTGLEAETRTRGRLALVQIALLSGETEKACTEIERVIEEARRYELVSLEMQAQQLLEQI